LAEFPASVVHTVDAIETPVDAEENFTMSITGTFLFKITQN